MMSNFYEEEKDKKEEKKKCLTPVAELLDL